MKDNEIAAFVNEVRDIAIQFRDAQQLRARLQEVLVPVALKVRLNQALENGHNALHRKLAAERLRADQGWERYEAANKAHMNAIMERAVEKDSSSIYLWLRRVEQTGTPEAKQAATVLKDYYEGA